MRRFSLSLMMAAAIVSGGVPAAAQDGTLTILFGDLHVHTNISPDAKIAFQTVMGPDEACAYARDVANLDFAAVTDHDIGIGATEWAQTRATVDGYNDPGHFTTFIGYEWTSAASYIDQADGTRESYLSGYGHRCVVFRGSDVPNEVWRYTDPRYDQPEELWAALSAWKQQGAGRDALTTPHTSMDDIVTEVTPEYERHLNNTVDWNRVNAEFQVLVEIFSKHGSSEGFDGAPEEEIAAAMTLLQDPASTHAQRLAVLQKYYLPIHSYWTHATHSVQYALGQWRTAPASEREGYRLGILCSTDDHEARPGSVHEDPNGIQWQANGGLVAVHAVANDRASIWEALRQRRVYGTSGPRILLWFDVRTDRGSGPMGSLLQSVRGPTLTMRARGADGVPIQGFEVIKNGVKVATVPASPYLADYTATWVDEQFTADSFYYVRALQQPTVTYFSAQGGDATDMKPYSLSERAWSSPVWVQKLAR